MINLDAFINNKMNTPSGAVLADSDVTYEKQNAVLIDVLLEQRCDLP
jgi:hypothetical protein